MPPLMLFAAGRGLRMGGLTENIPKPLVEAYGAPLIVHLLRRARAAGFRHCVINVSYRGAQIEALLGDGRDFGLSIAFSREAEPLEVAGGAATALPLLGPRPFVAVNADVASSYELRRLAPVAAHMGSRLAHLVLVPNPIHHPNGDFVFVDGLAGPPGPEALTYAGIGVFSPALFAGLRRAAPTPLRPLLLAAIAAGRVSAEVYEGAWLDVGTPERLAEASATTQLWPKRSQLAPEDEDDQDA